MISITDNSALNGALVVLSSELRSAVALTADSCATRASRRLSRLVEAGHGGLPQDPETTLPALYVAGREIRFDPRLVPPRADAGSPATNQHPIMRCGF